MLAKLPLRTVKTHSSILRVALASATRTLVAEEGLQSISSGYLNRVSILPEAKSRFVNNDLTADEVWKATEELEASAATHLGRLLFAFSRLDVALGLCLVWADGGKEIDALTPKVTALTFNQKLDALTVLVKSKFPERSNKRLAWVQWIEHAHIARTLRNQLIHGRWGVDPYAAEAINVIGLPTSPEQREVRYSLQSLENAVTEIGRLQSCLRQLCDQRPV